MDIKLDELSNLMHSNILLKANEIIHYTNLKKLPVSVEDLKDKLNHLEYIATGVAKAAEFNGHELPSGSIFIEKGTQDKLNNKQSLADNISFYINYAREQLKIEGLTLGQDIPNFNIFLKLRQHF